MQGVEWIASLYENGLNGILADEMGLGKVAHRLGSLIHLIDQSSQRRLYKRLLSLLDASN